MYGGFECVLISTDKINFGSNTKRHLGHTVCSHGYKLICVDERYSKPCKTYFVDDAIDTFLNDIMKESEFCSKPLVVFKKDHEGFKNSTKC